MIKVHPSDNIATWTDYLRNKDYLTNLYSLPDLWINKGLVYYESFGTSIFFFKKNPDFYNVYYCSSDQIALKQGLIRLNKLYPKETFVADVISGNSVFELSEGFYTHTTLVKMSRNGDFDLHNTFVRLADLSDLEEIQHVFYRHFDKYSEHLPLDEDVKDWIEKKHLYVYTEYSQIVGFVIFDITGLKSYLRYWFVHPAYRSKGIGSMLLRQFFADSRNTKYQILWVISDNENAITKYEHYGFKKENLINYVYIRKGN